MVETAKPAMTSALPVRTGTPVAVSSGLSMGAKAGIGVCVVVGAAVVVGVAVLSLCLWRRKRKSRVGKEGDEVPGIGEVENGADSENS